MNNQFTCIECGSHGWVSYEPPLGKAVLGHCSRCLTGNQEISVFAQQLALLESALEKDTTSNPGEPVKIEAWGLRKAIRIIKGMSNE